MITFPPELASLPSVTFERINQLPDCPGIYFVLDSSDRVIYIGQAENILKRWKAHHRQDQIGKIHRDTPVKIAWLVWNKEDLKVAENYCINFYHPLLNRTPVESAKIIPSEVILRELLEKIRLLIVIIGIQKVTQSQLPTVYLKYNYENSGKNGCARTIKTFQKENKIRANNLRITRTPYGKYSAGPMRPGSREHKTVSRIQSSYNNHWEIACNGVIIDITPVDKEEFDFYRDNATLRKLAGIKVRTVNNSGIINSFNQSLVSMIDDPIPLLWTGKTDRTFIISQP